MNKFILLLLVVVYTAHAGEFINYPFASRVNRLYVPTSYNPDSPNGYPLFVILHGCSQDPNDIAAGSKMNTYAEQYGFLALYPLQPSTANLNRCWNWFEVMHQSRSGEPGFIAGVTQDVMSNYKIDNEYVFVAGISAGGAMSVIVGATYSEIFSSIGVMAGLEFRAANSVLSAYTAMASGGPPPRTQAGYAYNAMKDYVKRIPEVFVVHGSSDLTVNIINGDQVTEQWIITNNLILGDGTDSGRIPDFTNPTKTTPGQAPGGGRTYTEYEYSDSETGDVVVKYWIVDAMGHAWSGGSTDGTYTDSRGPDASLGMVEWFLGRSSTVQNATKSNEKFISVNA